MELPKTNKRIYTTKISKTIGSYAIQVGAFSKRSGALVTKGNYEKITDKKVILKTAVVNNSVFYKVLITGFNSDTQALDFRTNNSLENAIIVQE